MRRMKSWIWRWEGRALDLVSEELVGERRMRRRSRGLKGRVEKAIGGFRDLGGFERD